MRLSRVRQKWAAGEPAMCVAIAAIDPAFAEMASLLGFDCLWLDLEHHNRSLETAASLMRAARVGVSDVIARPAKGEFLRMARMLEAGATGIMYPRCDHEDEAAEVVKNCKFMPEGERGVDGGGPDMPYCSMPLTEYLATANSETYVFIQIEDPRALERVERIAAVPGVDGIFFGPGDFSVFAGIPGQLNHPTILKAQERVAAATKAAGKRWGMPAVSPENLTRILSMGASFVASATDIVLLKTAFEGIQKQYATAGFTFDNRLAHGSTPV